MENTKNTPEQWSKAKDTVWRTVVKTITFKLFTTSVTAIFTGIGTAIFLHILMTIIFVLHERGWNLIKWGKK